jgi:hypothetical protein
MRRIRVVSSRNLNFGFEQSQNCGDREQVGCLQSARGPISKRCAQIRDGSVIADVVGD